MFREVCATAHMHTLPAVLYVPTVPTPYSAYSSRAQGPPAVHRGPQGVRTSPPFFFFFLFFPSLSLSLSPGPFRLPPPSPLFTSGVLVAGRRPYRPPAKT